MNREEIFKIVSACLAEGLAIEEDKIQINSRLVTDLGMDSLDFIDIIFAIEKKFSIKMRSAELDSLLRAEHKEEKLVDRKYIPRQEIEQLVSWLPLLKEAPDLNKITPHKLFAYITVESLILLIEKRISA